MLNDLHRIDDEIHKVELQLNQLRDWFNDPHRDPTFNHAELEAEVNLHLSALMGPGLSLTDAQAKRIGELDSNFRVTQDHITRLMRKGMDRNSISG